MKSIVFFLFIPFQLFAQAYIPDPVSWQSQTKNITIIRDHYGIPHIYGNTDADAVFGLMYAQCEDDYKRVEMNYLEKLGMTSLVKGPGDMFNDLLNKIIIDTLDTKADYEKAPAWLKTLCVAWADGINYYLYKHPAVKNQTGQPYQPWWPLMWTDGSIGAINTAGLGANQLKEFYGNTKVSSPTSYTELQKDEMLTGSNGFAFSPKITESKNSILYINPHVTFYFRPEVHMVSNEGLNVYGAVTWGQFFIYQGFNEHCGWMHTSSGVDAADSYIEKFTQKNGKFYYLYEGKEKPVREKNIKVYYTENGMKYAKNFTVYFTEHGPVMSKKDDTYISVRADNRLMNGLIQCWQRTKSKSFADFKKTLDLIGNISNNTVYADAEGNIAYWHGNRIPKRNPSFDWSKPVDGSIAATEWKGYHTVSEIVQSINPPNGWLQNCNSTPFTVAGINSPKKTDYPVYMAPDAENFRGIKAVRVLSEKKKYDLDDVIEAGYDRRLSAFEILIPALIAAYENSHSKTDYSYLSLPILTLKQWDFRSGEKSIATTLAIHYGEMLNRTISQVKVPGMENADMVEKLKKFCADAKSAELLGPFSDMIDSLKKKYGKWNIEWGEINRFQRISSDIDNKFDDSKPSIPVGFVSSVWGMLPSYTSRTFPGTTKRYGVHGNSFICAVEFGKKIRAKSLLAGGESGQEDSPHFFDQGEMYSKGKFKDVLFYKEDVLKHAERTYHPGE
jgi:acyl-homoserine lactone acylase PvdQ